MNTLDDRRRASARSGARGGVLLAAGVIVAAALSARPARADEAAAVGKITLLNRKAVDAYQHLEFETAVRLLNEALDQSERAGLDQHPIRARTFVTLGIVTLGGFKQRDGAVKYFRKALQIQPEVRLNPGLANPEIQAAFDEAIAALGTGGSDDLPPEKALVHEPVHAGQSQKPVAISVVPDKDLEATTFVLRYRGATAAAFTDVPMQKGATGAFEAAIPASATDGEQVAYFIEARRGNGSVVVKRGSAVDPIVVSLARPASDPAAAVATATAASNQPPATANRRFFFAISGGTGLGWASGTGEATRYDVASSGLDWTHSGQLSPELGYFLTPRLMLGVQMRLELVRGATPYHVPDPQPGECGTTEHVCSPAPGAVAMLLKLTWLLTDPRSALQPYLSFSAGAGNIRNVSRVGGIPACGSGNEACVDTIVGGPVLFGPGVGLRYAVSDAVGVVFGVNGLVGVWHFTATADVNLGLAFQL